jgi:hypothetical protein
VRLLLWYALHLDTICYTTCFKMWLVNQCAQGPVCVHLKGNRAATLYTLDALVVSLQGPLNVLQTNTVPSVVLPLLAGPRSLKTTLRIGGEATGHRAS